MIRILVACSMKSGSTYTARVLADYFGVEFAQPAEYWGRREQNLLEHELRPWLEDGRGFVIQMHAKPHVPNLEIVRKHGIRVVYLWRNLGDVLVSFDDHIRNEDNRNPVLYVHDRTRFNALPPQHRFRQIIEHAIPWYIAFHLSWREVMRTLPAVRCRYEDLASDPLCFFSRLLEGLGEQPDVQRLTSLLEQPRAATRFNRGVNFRSTYLVDDGNKARLDEMLLSHVEDLADLWSDLPWRGAGVEPASSMLEALPRLSAGGEPIVAGLPGLSGKSLRLRLVVLSRRRSLFRLAWQGGEVEALHRPSDGPRVVELSSLARDVRAFRLECFLRSPGFRLLGAPEGEILEALRLEI